MSAQAKTANPAPFWDRMAKRYSTQPIKDQAAYEFTLSRITESLKPGDKVLEVGCGTGATAHLLAGHVESYLGTDVSPKMIEIARGKPDAAPGLTFEVTDVSLDGLTQEGPFDAVIALNLLHLLPDVPGAMAGLAPLVKSGGLLISKTVVKADEAWPIGLRVIKLLLPLMQLLGRAPFVQFMTPDELDSHHTAAGFEIIETAHAPVGPPPSRFIIARKTS